MNNDQFFPMSLVGEAREDVIQAVNMGIDSCLTGFTRSTFEHNQTKYCLRLECLIHLDEMEILIRRLHQLWIFGNENAGSLADDIVSIHYGKEII